MTPEQVKKLPRMARDYISTLEVHLRDQRTALAEAEARNELAIDPKGYPFEVFTQDYKSVEVGKHVQQIQQNLGARSVCFRLPKEHGAPNGRIMTFRLDNDGRIFVNAQHGTLVVRHGASNTCTLDMEM